MWLVRSEDVRSARFVKTLARGAGELTSSKGTDCFERARSVLESLAERTGDTRSGNDAVCLSRVQGTYPIQTPVVQIGGRQPLGVNAGGLALLSCLPDAEVTRSLQAIAPRLGVYGELDAEELRAHCARAQEQGFALIANKAAPGVSALGLPIRSSTGTAIAAITVAATVERMNDQRVKDILPLLRDAVFLRWCTRRMSDQPDSSRR
jgi:DNA-binding IclR family transcriptional regulator